MPMRYMKEYTGYVTGSLGGRDDGYPETKRKFYNDIQSLVREHGTQHGEQYFIVNPMPPADLESAYMRHRTAEQRAKDNAEREKDEAEFKRLAEKLGRTV